MISPALNVVVSKTAHVERIAGWLRWLDLPQHAEAAAAKIDDCVGRLRLPIGPEADRKWPSQVQNDADYSFRTSVFQRYFIRRASTASSRRHRLATMTLGAHAGWALQRSGHHGSQAGKKRSGTSKRTGSRGARRLRPSDEADLIFHSGKVYPVDRRRGWAEAVAVKDGRIVRVGTDRAVQKAAGKRYEAGRSRRAHDDAGPGRRPQSPHPRRQLDMFEVAFRQPVVRRHPRARQGTRREDRPGQWISGGIWSSELVGRLGQAPAKAELDAASLGRPVMLRDDSLHNRWVNSPRWR